MANRALVSIYKESAGTWFHIGGDTPNVRSPYDYDASSSTLVDSARNSEGVVVGQVIKEDVAKIEMKWNYLTVAEYSALAQLFDSAYGGNFFVYVSYFDVVLGDFESDNTITPTLSTHRIFYPNDRKAVVAHITLDANGKPIGYKDVSLHLIDTGRREE